jgi:hypothetical protein
VQKSRKPFKVLEFKRKFKRSNAFMHKAIDEEVSEAEENPLEGSSSRSSVGSTFSRM